MKKNIGIYVIITLLVLIVIIMLLNANNQSEKSISVDLLLDEKYELREDGGYKLTLLDEKRNNIQFEKEYNFDKDLNEIEFHESIGKQYDHRYRYKYNTNIGYGINTEDLEEGIKTAKFYDAIYDFNTGSFSCNASASTCNTYLISIIELKAKYLSYMK